jgi:hypothetical protein
MSELSMEVRMALIERWKEDMNAILVGEFGQPGLVQQMRTFIDNKKESDRWVVVKVAIAAIGAPILYDAFKHWVGWK